MKKLSIVILLVISLAIGGCAGMSDTEQRTLSGAAIGTAGGYLYDHHEKAQQKAHDQAYEQGYTAGKKSQ